MTDDNAIVTEECVLNTLAEKIKRQESVISQLSAELQQAKDASVDLMLKQLRLHETVLLFVGQDESHFAQQITDRFGSEVAQAVLMSLFVLNRAPVSGETREQIRLAVNHGMSRW